MVPDSIVILVLPECSEYRKSKVELICDHLKNANISYEIIECPDHAASLIGKIIVLEPFNDLVINRITTNNNYVFGASFLLQCLQIHEPLPLTNTHLYGSAMRNTVIATTGLTKESNNMIEKYTLALGGSFMKDLTTAVTHLIVGCVSSKKYAIAKSLGLATVCKEWIFDIWRHHIEDDKELIPQNFQSLQKYECPVFQGLNISSSGIVDSRERECLRNMIMSNGGFYTDDLHAKTCHILVVNLPKGKKFQCAQKFKIPCVNLRWITDCVSKHEYLSFSGYETKFTTTEISLSQILSQSSIVDNSCGSSKKEAFDQQLSLFVLDCKYFSKFTKDHLNSLLEFSSVQELSAKMAGLGVNTITLPESEMIMNNSDHPYCVLTNLVISHPQKEVFSQKNLVTLFWASFCIKLSRILDPSKFIFFQPFVLPSNFTPFQNNNNDYTKSLYNASVYIHSSQSQNLNLSSEFNVGEYSKIYLTEICNYLGLRIVDEPVSCETKYLYICLDDTTLDSIKDSSGNLEISNLSSTISVKIKNDVLVRAVAINELVREIYSWFNPPPENYFTHESQNSHSNSKSIPIPHFDISASLVKAFESSSYDPTILCNGMRIGLEKENSSSLKFSSLSSSSFLKYTEREIVSVNNQNSKVMSSLSHRSNFEIDVDLTGSISLPGSMLKSSTNTNSQEASVYESAPELMKLEQLCENVELFISSSHDIQLGKETENPFKILNEKRVNSQNFAPLHLNKQKITRSMSPVDEVPHISYEDLDERLERDKIIADLNYRKLTSSTPKSAKFLRSKTSKCLKCPDSLSLADIRNPKTLHPILNHMVPNERLMATRERFFMFTGIDAESQTNFTNLLDSLRNSQNIDASAIEIPRHFDERCTHLIVGKRNSLTNEKFLSALALTGVWILSLKYIDDCCKSNDLLPEKDYEYGTEIFISPERNESLSEVTPPVMASQASQLGYSTVASAVRYWREKSRFQCPFANWKVLLIFPQNFDQQNPTDPGKMKESITLRVEGISSVLRFGGADVSFFNQSTASLYLSVDFSHIFVDSSRGKVSTALSLIKDPDLRKDWTDKIEKSLLIQLDFIIYHLLDPENKRKFENFIVYN